MTEPQQFAEWSAQWLAAGRFTGPRLLDETARTAELRRLWRSEIPGGWERTPDERLFDSGVRYQRHHRDQVPVVGSEHELELDVLRPDPTTVVTESFGCRVIDGVNAVPLATDKCGGRTGNVEADMLLLAAGPTGPRLFLVEVKTRSNNAWYAAAESLRQLRLFCASPSAQAIMSIRQSGLVAPIPVSAVVLAPVEFYLAPGARRNAVAPARRLFQTMCTEYGLDARLAVWNPSDRAITEVPTNP